MTAKLFDAELRLMRIVWELEPMTSRSLVEQCASRLGWNKSTTYTVLRKLCERGILRNDKTIVSSVATLEDVQRYDSNAVIERSFDGSLPKFIAAFMDGRKLSAKDAEEIKRVIDSCTE